MRRSVDIASATRAPGRLRSSADVPSAPAHVSRAARAQKLPYPWTDVGLLGTDLGAGDDEVSHMRDEEVFARKRGGACDMEWPGDATRSRQTVLQRSQLAELVRGLGIRHSTRNSVDRC